MDNKRSKKPFFLVLVAAVVLVVGAAAFITPTIKPQTVEQSLPAETFLK